MSHPAPHGSCHCGRPLDQFGAESMSETAGLCPACRASRLAAAMAAIPPPRRNRGAGRKHRKSLSGV